MILYETNSMAKSVFKKIVVSVLTWEARLVLKRYKPRIVAVTGSVGKTSTKDAIFTALSNQFFVRRSEKSFNSEIGIPLTILGLQNAWSSPFGWVKNMIEGLALGVLFARYPEWLVLEVGADRPGDIKSVAQWLRPDVVVMTRIPEIPVHVEFFPTPEALMREKRYLAEGVKSDGVLILNADDERVRGIPHPYKGRVVHYGFAQDADVHGVSHKVSYRKEKPVGTLLKVKMHEHDLSLTIDGGLGMQHVYPVLAALAVGDALGVSKEKLKEAFEHYAPPSGRMRVLPGLKGTTIIDDTYNSSPAALEQALLTLKGIETSGQKIAVLGDMLELGVYSAYAHKEIGKMIPESATMLIAVGVRAQAIAESAKEAGMDPEKIRWFSDAREAGKPLELLLSENDVILIKGSQSMRMERLVEEIMAHPEKKADLLVRQDEFWQAKI